MNRFYDLYIRFMVWLGAAPPKGYAHLLPDAEKNNNKPTRKLSDWIKKLEFLLVLLLACGWVALLVGFYFGSYFAYTPETSDTSTTSVVRLPETAFPLQIKWQTSLSGLSDEKPTYQDGLILISSSVNITPTRSFNIFGLFEDNQSHNSQWNAVDAHTGKAVWFRPVGQHKSLSCLTSKYLVVSKLQETDDFSSVIVLNPMTGDVVWERKSTLVGICSNTLVIIQGSRGWIEALDISTGSSRWSGAKPSKGFLARHDYIIHNPETDKFFAMEATLPWDYYFINAESGQLENSIEKTDILPGVSNQHELFGNILLIDDQQIFMSITPDFKSFFIVVLDAQTGEIIQRETSYGLFQSLVITQNTMYTYDGELGVIALDRESLKKKWIYSNPWHNSASYRALSSLVTLNGIGYIIFSDITLRAIDLETGQELGYWQPQSLELSEDAKAGLTTSDNMLFVSFGGGKLYGFSQ